MKSRSTGLLMLASAGFFIASAQAQNSGTITNHAFVIGKGPGVAGYTSLLCGSAQLAVGQSAADPICRTVTGDVTITAAGVTAIGTAKVTYAMLNSTGFGTGVLTALGVNVGSAGAPVLFNGAGGTPSSMVGTNITGLPLSGLVSQGAYTLNGNFTGSSGPPTASTIGALTQKASPVSGDTVVIADSAASGALKYATVGSIATAGSVSSLNGQTGGLFATYAPQGRLTPVSGSPVWSTDQAAKTVLYYDATGMVGKQVPVYNGSNVVMLPICAANTAGTCNIALTLGSNWPANTAFDVYGYNNGGALGLCTVAWSNSGAGTSTRATTLQALDAFQTNSAIATCRTTNAATTSCAANQCTYLASFLTNGSTGTVDFKFGTAASGGGAACLCIYNPYNQVQQSAMITDSGASYNYTLAGYQQARASAGNQASILIGSAGSAIRAGAYAQSSNSTGGIINSSGIGVDSITANSAQIQLAAQSSAGNTAPSTAIYSGSPSAGVHVIARLEYSQAAGTTTWYAGSITGVQAGLELTWLN